MYDIKKLKQLREETEVSFSLCKKALEESKNNLVEAKKLLFMEKKMMKYLYYLFTQMQKELSPQVFNMNLHMKHCILQVQEGLVM